MIVAGGAGRFAWYELRTAAPAAARAFYAAVVGAGFEGDGRVSLGGATIGEVGLLPAAAAARGAPSHWLTHVHVADVDAAEASLLAAGAQRLGPRRRSEDGFAVAGLRCPLGAPLAVTSRPPLVAPPVWHDLAVRDPGRALAVYGAQFGWTELDALAGPLGVHRRFAYAVGEPAVGGVFDTTGRPEIHDHWLLSFVVGDLGRALAAAVEGGGEVIAGPTATGDGSAAASLHDPQGAIFGLRARGY